MLSVISIKDLKVTNNTTLIIMEKIVILYLFLLLFMFLAAIDPSKPNKLEAIKFLLLFIFSFVIDVLLFIATSGEILPAKKAGINAEI